MKSSPSCLSENLFEILLASEAFWLQTQPPSYPPFSFTLLHLDDVGQNIISWHKFLPPCCFCWPWTRLNDSGSGNNILCFLAHCKCKCRLIRRKVVVFGAWVLGTKVCHAYKLTAFPSWMNTMARLYLNLRSLYLLCMGGQGLEKKSMFLVYPRETNHFHLTVKLQFHLSHRSRRVGFMLLSVIWSVTSMPLRSDQASGRQDEIRVFMKMSRELFVLLSDP